MALRDKLKGKNCFTVFSMQEWDTGGEVVTLRGLTRAEANALDDARPVSEEGMTHEEKIANKEKRESFILKTFAYLIGDSCGKRIYEDSESDLKEIQQNIPALVIMRVYIAGMEFNADEVKKN